MTSSRLDRPGHPPIAYRHRAGRGPTIVFLPGYMSDMSGTKATALDGWAAGEGRAMLRFDYAGCGESGGGAGEATLASWLGDALAVIDAATEGPLLLVGSSMGGWIMLLAALALPDRVKALVGIAAAPDFTEWSFNSAQKAILQRQGAITPPSTYYDCGPLTVTRAFWESGQANLLLGGAIDIDVPVRLLHGREDPDVPVEISFGLASALRSADVQVTVIKDGDHRLSRDRDIVLLVDTVARLLDDL